MFDIYKVDDYKYDHYVFLNDSTDPDFIIDDIFENFNKSRGKNFDVLIDCFLRTGYSYNRFIEIHFRDSRYSGTTIINPRDISEIIKTNTTNILKKNTFLLNESSFTKREKEILLQNLL